MIQYVVHTVAHAANLAVALYALHKSGSARSGSNEPLAVPPSPATPRPLTAPAPAVEPPQPRARHDVHEIRKDGSSVVRYVGDDEGAAEAVFQQLKYHHPDSSHSWHRDGQLHKHRTP